jgi:hypothetical protein
MRRLSWIACGLLVVSCGDTDPRGDQDDEQATTDGDTGGDGDESTDESGGEEETDTGSEPEVLCGEIDIPLVLDPKANVFGPGNRGNLMTFYDSLVVETGATVRVRPNPGTELPFETECGGKTIVWGADFEVDPDAADRLHCMMDAAKAWDSQIDDGDWMFSGLMFPILFEEDWPTEGDALMFPMLLGATDDELENMYSRSGMASESVLRNVLDYDRRLWSAFTMGDSTGHELELFALTLGDHSLWVNHQDTPIADGLDAWLPEAVQACADYDLMPPEELPEGCTKLDVLFVVDGSYSMDDEKQALQGLGGNDPVFAEFTDVLLDELGTIEDFHVGVTSAQPGDDLLHTHRDFPEMPESPETDCLLQNGERWIVGPADDLEQKFACIASTAQTEIQETTVYNAGAALANPVNEGFLRDDSILLVVFLTDEDTQSETTLVEQRQALLDAVGDRLDRILVFGIAGDQGVFEMPKTTCHGAYGAAVPGRKLTSILYSFRDQGVFHNLCDGTLGDAFEQVLDDVVRTCEQYQPEG